MQERKLENLVVACGHHCPMRHHPAERWLSIDPASERKADIPKMLETTTAQDFKPFNVPEKFNYLFIEGISNSISIEQIKMLEKLSNDQSTLLILASDSKALLTCLDADFNVKAFLFTGAFCVLAKKPENLKNTIDLIETDLKFLYSKIGNKLRVIHKEITHLQSEYKGLDSVLLSALAHLRAYVKQREERTWRNFFKDDQYQQFLKLIEKDFVDFNDGKLTIKAMLKKFSDWQKILPSNSSPHYKLKYDTLSRIFSICEHAILYYSKMLAHFCEYKDEAMNLDSPSSKIQNESDDLFGKCRA